MNNLDGVVIKVFVYFKFKIVGIYFNSFWLYYVIGVCNIKMNNKYMIIFFRVISLEEIYMRLGRIV